MYCNPFYYRNGDSMNASELVIKLHDLARETKDNRIRKIADDLAEIAKENEEFARKREGFYDVGNMSLDDIKRSNRE